MNMITRYEGRALRRERSRYVPMIVLEALLLGLFVAVLWVLLIVTVPQ